MTHYEILGIHENSTIQEIKKAYRILARKYHPDVSPVDSSSDTFLLIQQAYEVLSDPTTRQRYDQDLQATQGKNRRSRHNDSTSPLLDWLFHTQMLHVTRFSSQRHRLHVDIILTPEEARYGGSHILSTLVQVPCPTCHGLSRNASIECWECQREGTVERYIRILHRIPPDIRHHTIEYLSLDRLGMPEIEIEIVYLLT
jgi:DnaJ-class molecular chaperone